MASDLTIHELKVLPEYYRAIVNDIKTFEIRFNDRGYKVGDVLLLKEWDGEAFTGNSIKRRIAYVLDDNSGYVLEGYVVMSIVKEKQRSVKPIEVDTDLSYFKCGNCEGLIYYSDEKESHKYCLNCGQKIDWGY